MIQSKIHDIKVKDGVLMACRLTPHGQECWEDLAVLNKKVDEQKDCLGNSEEKEQKLEEIVLNLKHGVYKIAETELRIVVNDVVTGELVSAGDARRAYRGELFFANNIVPKDCDDTKYYAGRCGLCILKRGVYVFSRHGQLKGFLSDGNKFVRVKINACRDGIIGECGIDKREDFKGHGVGNGSICDLDIKVKKPGVYMLGGESNFVVVNNKGECFKLTTIISPGAVVGGIYFSDCVGSAEGGGGVLYKNKITGLSNYYLTRDKYVFNYIDNKFLGYINNGGEFVRVKIELDDISERVYYHKEQGKYVYGDDSGNGCIYVGTPKWVKPGLKFFVIGKGLVKILEINGNRIIDSRSNVHDMVDFLNNAYCYCKQIHEGELC